jgi:hypothetical protein
VKSTSYCIVPAKRFCDSADRRTHPLFEGPRSGRASLETSLSHNQLS